MDLQNQGKHIALRQMKFQLQQKAGRMGWRMVHKTAEFIQTVFSSHLLQFNSSEQIGPFRHPT